MIRFALNRNCSPNMTLDALLALAKQVDAGAVEIRNDIQGREFADGTQATELRTAIGDARLELASINALQRFNHWTDARAAEARSLIEYAAALGASGIVMCPVIEADHGWSVIGSLQ
jgi:2-keto-myo-inositol isomerase